jgi:predicted metal-dependent peptidase
MNALERAKFRLFMRHPFFAVLVSSLEIETIDTGTCATDGKRLWVNPDFLQQVILQDGPEAGAFALAHEAMHAALRHPARRRGRDPEVWNAAADYATNAILVAGGMTPPTGKFAPLVNRKYENMTAEQIYASLMRRPPRRTPAPAGGQGEGFPGPGGGEGNQGGQEKGTKGGRSAGSSGTITTVPVGPGAGGKGSADGSMPQVEQQPWGDHELWSRAPHDPATEAEAETIWQGRIAEAARAAKMAGKLPADLERLIEEYLRPRIDWRAALANFVVPARSDYGLRPDRRLWPDVYVPDLDSEAIHDLVVAIDTSGSISQQELDMFLAELRGILTSYPEVRVHVAVCDAKVHNFITVNFQEGELLPEVKLRGGGGTDFRPVFTEIRRRGLRPCGLVFLTDGYGAYPDRPPAYPVLWVLAPEHEDPPWGSKAVLA